jgi:hypothetical protein
MTMKLTLDDLAKGLIEFSDAYFALDVFASDVVELDDPSTRAALTQRPDRSFEFERRDRRFNLRVFDHLGVARVTFAESMETAAVTGAAGVAIGAATARKGEELGGAAIGLLVGLLVGAAIGAPAPKNARRVFALAFDPNSRQWRAYDGGLVRWVKRHLGSPEVLQDLPRQAQGA